MRQRARPAMKDELTGGSLAGEIEVHESLISGKAQNTHKGRKRQVQKAGRNTAGKTVVLGMLERGGKIRASLITNRTKGSIQLGEYDCQASI